MTSSPLTCVTEIEEASQQAMTDALCQSVGDRLDNAAARGLALHLTMPRSTTVTAQFSRDGGPLMGQPTDFSVSDTDLSQNMMDRFAGILVAYLNELEKE